MKWIIIAIFLISILAGILAQFGFGWIAAGLIFATVISAVVIIEN